jgi:hypothetical protein
MALGQEHLLTIKRIRENPFEFLRGVRTLDQVDKKTPIKHFPLHLPYVRKYVETWVLEPKLAVPKSRRMIMSWTNIALYVWDTMFQFGRHNAFVSKKEDDSNDLVERAWFIIRNLDYSVWGLPEGFFLKELQPKRTFCMIEFPSLMSKIEGFPSGADQLRQFTFSGIFGDECAFWEDAQKFYAASYPTLEGGGRMNLVSSPGPGFFKRIVFDQLDEEGDAKIDSLKLEHGVSEGIETWRNPKNQFFIFQLHYSANPRKNDESYRTAIKSSMPKAQYLQEYELQWESFIGMPVYQDWDDRIHLVHKEPTPIAGLPLLRGWDFGLTPACIVAQLQGNQLVVLREFTATNMGADRFSDLVLAQCFAHWPNWGPHAWRDFIDPAGTMRKDTDEGTCAQILDGKGLNCIPGAVAWEGRRKAVENRLVFRDKDGPGLILHEGTAPVLVRGFRGGYRYPEKAIDIEPQNLRPIKDAHSHPHDALQMIGTGIQGMLRQYGIAPTEIPMMAYGPEAHSG